MKFKPYYSFIVSFIALGFVLFKLLYGYTATLDITGADEAGYLSAVFTLNGRI